MSIEISVGEPSKSSDSYGSYISYKVNTSAHKAGFEHGDFSVVRRYSDFAWLCSELSRAFPGVILPALPEKQSVGRFSSEFVETRRRALEKFLKRVSDHPDLGESAQFATFLQADEARFTQAKEASKAGKAKIAERAQGWFQASINTLSTSKIEVEKTATDVKIDEITVYINALEKQLQNVTKHSSQMVRRSRESAHSIFEFAQSLTWLGQCEADSLGASLTQVGTALEAISEAATKHSESEVSQLEEPLEEYSRYTTSVKAAIQTRLDKKNAYVAALTDLEVKQQAHTKAASNAKEKDLAAKQEAVEKAQVAADKAKEEYDVVSERLLHEFENFKRQKTADIRNILLAFVNLQIEFSRRSEESWEGVVPILEGIAVSTPATSFAAQSAPPSAGSLYRSPVPSAPAWTYGAGDDGHGADAHGSSGAAAGGEEDFVGV